jgi:hypothetical protein
MSCRFPRNFRPTKRATTDALGRADGNAGWSEEDSRGAGLLRTGPATRNSPGAASRGGLPYLDDAARVNIVDVTVNRNFAGNERMLANATHVIRHA